MTSELPELNSDVLISAYAQGIFPMADEWQTIRWYRPDPRAILPLDGLHASKSLLRLMDRRIYHVEIDRDFEAIMRACAMPAPGREETWISEEIVAAYVDLHRRGYAHSVEVLSSAGELVGGLYGVTVRGLFAGESMFSVAPSASKVALVHLVQRLRAQGLLLLDVQYLTPHLSRMGAIEISALSYDRLLQEALRVDARFQD